EAVVRSLHGTPAEVAVAPFGRHVHVDAGPMDRAAAGQLAECLLLHADAVVHGEQLRDELIVDDEHWQFQANMRERCAPRLRSNGAAVAVSTRGRTGMAPPAVCFAAPAAP